MAAAVAETVACGGLTSGSSTDAGRDMGVAPAHDGSGRSDSTSGSGTGSGSSGVDAASLSPPCAAVLKCCPAIPQVKLAQCTAVATTTTELLCSETLGQYLANGWIGPACASYYDMLYPEMCDLGPG